jgi:membrane-associated phospholipid phosphatase
LNSRDPAQPNGTPTDLTPHDLTPVAAPGPVQLLPLALVTIALFVVAALFMTGGDLNVRGFTAVQDTTRALPDAFWSMVTVCGTGVGAFALISPALLRQPRFYAAAIVSAALAGTYSNGVKHLFGLPRPAVVLDPARLHVIGETLRHNSFPSGHSVTAFTLAAVLVFASTRPLRTAMRDVAISAAIGSAQHAVRSGRVDANTSTAASVNAVTE